MAGPLPQVIAFTGELVAGGYFTDAGGVPARSVATWDGTSWSALGAGIDNGGLVQAMCTYDGHPVASGFYGDVQPYVLRWDGTRWNSMLDYDRGYVSSLIPCGGGLVAGGSFGYTGFPREHIQEWDGSRWRPLGSGLDGTVWALAIYNGDLIAGGHFTHSGTTEVNHIARWDGVSWAPLGGGLIGDDNPFVAALTVHDGALIVGGQFTEAGGVPANNIARWNGTLWSPLDTGTNGSIDALTSYQGELIAAGRFSTAGGVPANRVAAWRDVPSAVDGGSSTGTAALTVWPNPAHDLSRISFRLPSAGATQVHILDLTGRVVRTLMAEPRPPGDCTINWDGRNDSGSPLPSGIYLTRVSTEAGVTSARVIRVR